MKRCMIFAAGDFDADAVIGKARNDIAVQRGDSFCIAADGGLKWIQALRIVPDLIIGDMDSITEEALLARFDGHKRNPIKKLPIEKDDTDMLAAIREGWHKQ